MIKLIKKLDFKVVVLLIILAKLWLVSDFWISAITFANIDDGLFFKLANNLKSFKWLGSYDNLTLAKGPFFSMFMALTNISGLSLIFAIQAFYIVACVLVLKVMKPIIGNNKVTLFLFAVIIFSPITYADSLARVMREAVYPALSLISLFSFILLAKSYSNGKALIYRWAIVAGVSLACFWLTREEGIWLIPSILIIIGYFIIVESIKEKSWKQPRLFLLLSIPFVILFFSIQAVSLINKIKYNIYEVVEFKNKEFIKAYSALTRVEGPNKRIQYIPITTETRKEIYKVCPSFNELSGAEESLYPNWAKAGPYCNLRPETCGEIAGGWFMWAFRDAVASKGYYKDGKTAAQYYKRLADEINAACDCGKLTCLPERNTMMPRIDENFIRAYIPVFFQSFHFVVMHEKFGFREFESIGSQEELYRWREFTRSKLSEPEMSLLPSSENNMSSVKKKMFSAIAKIYTYTTLVLFYLSLILFGAVFFMSIKNRKASLLFMLSISLLVGVSIRIALLTIIEISSFPAINPLYLSPVYPMVYMFIIFIFWEFYRLVTKKAEAQG